MEWWGMQGPVDMWGAESYRFRHEHNTIFNYLAIRLVSRTQTAHTCIFNAFFFFFFWQWSTILTWMLQQNRSKVGLKLITPQKLSFKQTQLERRNQHRQRCDAPPINMLLTVHTLSLTVFWKQHLFFSCDYYDTPYQLFLTFLGNEDKSISELAAMLAALWGCNVC